MQSNVDDLIKALEDAKQQILDAVKQAKINPNQVQIVALSDLSKTLGLVQAGEFRSGNGIEPGRGFSGVRIGYPPFSYNGWWNIVGVYNDSLQFGLRANDGAALFAGGNAVLDADGLKLKTLMYGIQHEATYQNQARTGKLGMVVREGTSIPALNLTFEGPAGGSNVVTNGDAETGTLTGWTDSDSAWEASSIRAFAGTYSLHHKPTVTTYPGELTQTIEGIFSDSYYVINFRCRLDTGEFTPSIQLEWLDAADAIVRTDVIFGTNQPAWSARTQSIKSPTTADSVRIVLNPGDPFGDAYFDDITFNLAGIFSAVYFTPDFLYTGRSFIVSGLELPVSATDGFLYIPTMDGTPTGVPDTHTGTVAMVYDTANNYLYIYNGGWVKVALT